jgi:hypothetical protein
MDAGESDVVRTIDEWFRDTFGLEPQAFVGMPLTQAQAMAADRGALIRVLSEDGRNCGALKLDKLRRRVNVDVEHGTIVRVDGVY